MSRHLEPPRVLPTLALLATLLISFPADAQRERATEHKQRGDSLAAKGDHAGAEKSYKKAVAADPGYRAAYTALSTHYLRRQKYGAAVSLLERAVKRDRRYTEGWYNLAYGLRKSGKMSRAIKAYRTYAKLDPTSADPYFGLGLAYKSTGQYALAADAFRRYAALEKRPDRKAWITKAKRMSQEMTGKAGGGKAAEVASGETGGGAGESARLQGDRLYRQGRVTEAVAKYRAAIKADPRDQAAHDALATSLFRLRRYNEAVKVFTRATRADPAYTQGWYNLAYAQRKLGRHAKAVAAYKRYIKLNPDNADPYFGLALAYKGMGRKRDAASAFEKYVVRERRPGQEKWIHKARVEIARLQGKPAPAAGAPTPAMPSLPPAAEDGAGTATPSGAVAAKDSAATAKDEAARKQREKDMAMMLATTRYTEKSGKKGRRGRRGRGKGKRAAHLPLVNPAEDRPIAPPVPGEPSGAEASESGKLRARADGLARGGKCRVALPLYRKAARLDPFNSGAYDGLAYCSYQLGKHAEGIRALRMAMRDNPKYKRAWLHKARLERAANKNVAAVGSFRRYLAGPKPSPDAHFELARTLRALKMKDQAIAAYGAYLRT